MFHKPLRRLSPVAAALSLALATAGHAQTKPAAAPAKPATDTAKPAKKAGITDKVKTSRKTEGLFTVYQDTAAGNLQLYVKKNQLDKEFIYQSYSMNGPASLGLNQMMHRANLTFRIQKYYDRLEFLITNNNFYFDSTNAISKAKNADIPDAVFYSDKVSAEDENGYLISADGLFLSDKMDPVKPVIAPGMPPGAMFLLGNLNPTKSKYSRIASYPENTDVTVDLAYDNPMPFNGGDQSITDARYVRVRMQHTFIEMPSNGYRPRRDDPRVGFFSDEVNDQTSMSATPYKDVIHRWHLEKKDPSAAVSEPVQPIVWWIENTTPVEYRQTIVEAGQKWNEAFEKAGFRNAVVMKIQPDNADWDAGDIRYNVIRWVSSATPPYGAIGPSFVNPKTGQILGADITVEFKSGSSSPVFEELFSFSGETADKANLTASLEKAFGHQGEYCSLGNELKAQFAAGATILDGYGADEKQISQMHQQFLYYLILHEMGHTLGLQHNMKSSQLWKPSEINNTTLTHQHGLIGSVMDYPAINVAADKTKQGDYYTTKPGPYDLWAIEYGYRPFSAAEEEAGLQRILARSTEPQLAFGNDADDMRSPGKAIDPRVNVNDLTSDAIGYAEERFKIVNATMGRLKTKYSKPNQGYAELRSRYGVLISQRNNMYAAISRYVGGVYIDRSFAGQHSPNKPYTPVPAATQKRAIEVLGKYLFAPDAFAADTAVFAYLQPQRRGYNFFSSTEDPKLNAYYGNLQAATLAHLLHPATLLRVTNSRLYGNTYAVADVMNDLNKQIFDADLKGNVNMYRQQLQTLYVQMLAGLIGERSYADQVTQAAARYSLKKIKTKLATALSTSEETKAHRANLVYLVDNATTVK
jgi:hypothetical protein